jgi:hypothetical protein
MPVKTGAQDLLRSLEQCLAAARPLAEAAGVTLQARIPADPRLLEPDNSDLGRLGPAVLAWAIERAGRGTALDVGLEVGGDGMIRLEIAEPELFGHLDESRCRVINAIEPGCSQRAFLEPDLADLTRLGGRLLNCPAAGSRVHLMLRLLNRAAEQR